MPGGQDLPFPDPADVTLTLDADGTLAGWPAGAVLVREIELVDGKPMLIRSHFRPPAALPLIREIEFVDGKPMLGRRSAAADERRFLVRALAMQTAIIMGDGYDREAEMFASLIAEFAARPEGAPPPNREVRREPPSPEPAVTAPPRSPAQAR